MSKKDETVGAIGAALFIIFLVWAMGIMTYMVVTA